MKISDSSNSSSAKDEEKSILTVGALGLLRYNICYGVGL